MLRGLVEKVGNRQEQMGKISREMNTLRKNKKMLKQRSLMEMKDAFDGIIARLGTTKKEQ